MHLYVSYIPYATSSKGKTGNIITLTQFEEGDLLSKTRDDAESSEKSDDDSIMPPLICEDEMDGMDTGDESEDEPMSTEMLEDICDSIQPHQSVNRREAHYKISDHIK